MSEATKPPRGISNTSMCVRCLKRKAAVRCGHVTVGKRWLTAGWCRRCEKLRDGNHLAGWRGHWQPAMNPKPRTPGTR